MAALTQAYINQDVMLANIVLWGMWCVNGQYALKVKILAMTPTAITMGSYTAGICTFIYVITKIKPNTISSECLVSTADTLCRFAITKAVFLDCLSKKVLKHIGIVFKLLSETAKAG